MVSMIDIVFLLLIFFLVTTSFVRPERRLDSSLQSRPGRAATPPTDLDPAIIDVIRRESGFAFRIGQVESSDLGAIEQVLGTFRNKELGALVRAVDDAPFDMPARAISACHRLGFQPVTYVPLK